VSARKALDSYIESLQILARSGAEDRSDKEQQADAEHRSRLIDAFAHDLAEQQRAHADTLECYNGALYDGQQLDELPDLIDPKARRAATEGDTP